MTTTNSRYSRDCLRFRKISSRCIVNAERPKLLFKIAQSSKKRVIEIAGLCYIERYVFRTLAYIFDKCRFQKHAMQIDAFYHIMQIFVINHLGQNFL